jgi:hypothetical protein
MVTIKSVMDFLMGTQIISDKFRELFAASFQPRNSMLRDKLSSEALRFNLNHEMIIFNELLYG